MKRINLLILIVALTIQANAARLLTPFETSKGKRSATYFECIAFYYKLASTCSFIHIDTAGSADAAYPLHLVLWSNDKQFDPASWDRTKKVVMLINNGIHPGEPDGIDASMMLLRDAAAGTLKIPDNVVLAFIPVYNIGGALNRNNSTRVNQDGPEQYGFRGNGQNLDLNRDFTKRDSREARSFARLFHRLDPSLFIDNHVSDGADYQHTMTLLSSQYDKLGGVLGSYFRNQLDPMLYRSMNAAGWPMIPYVNAEEAADKGWTAFIDPPRFSSGYATLFGCIAWVPESHMLKPFDQRVRATYAFMNATIDIAGKEANSIIDLRRKHLANEQQQTIFPLSWKDSAATMWPFKGYAAAYKKSEVTGEERLYYDHNKPISMAVPIRDRFVPAYAVKAPRAYILPQGWQDVADRLREDGIQLMPLNKDTVVWVSAYTIDSFRTSPAPYEKHYKHSAIHVTPKSIGLKCKKGDYLIPTSQPGRRFIIEMLEPTGEDSYFAWNYFDAVLQRKEGYSDYRWEDIAAGVLRDYPDVKAALEEKKRTDPTFAKDAAAQLFYVYQHSRWYEPAHMRYPVYRIE